PLHDGQLGADPQSLYSCLHITARLETRTQLSLVQPPPNQPVKVPGTFYVSFRPAAYRVFNIALGVQAVSLPGHRRDHVYDRLTVSAGHAKNHLDLVGQFDRQVLPLHTKRNIRLSASNCSWSLIPRQVAGAFSDGVG